MPEFKQYPGEHPVAARRRIKANKIKQKFGLPAGGRNPRPRVAPTARPGIGLGSRPGVRNPGLGRTRPGANRPQRPGVRRPGSGGSRRMGTPSMGRVLTGKNRRGY